MLLSPCLQWVLYAIIPSVYKIYRPPFGRDDILHITLLLRKRAICGNIVPRAGHNIQIHSGIIAHIDKIFSIQRGKVEDWKVDGGW